MSILYIMVPLAFLLAGAGVWAFIRAARGGQFDDLETPAVRMLFDDDADRPAPDQPGSRAIGPSTSGQPLHRADQPGSEPDRKTG